MVGSNKSMLFSALNGSKMQSFKDSRKEKWLEFCRRTSLHGYSYLFRDDKPISHTIGWICVLVASLASVSTLLFMNIDEFARASVSFNLESPTTPLSEVYFPSIVVCNMNYLRKSFVFSLLRDPELQGVQYDDLLQVISEVFINGPANATTPIAQADRDLIQSVLASQAYDQLFEELFREVKQANSTVGNIPIAKWHTLNLANQTRANLWRLKRATVGEIASQFREGEMLARVDFPGFGAYFEAGFGTDISETCRWITPFWLEPGDMTDFDTVKKSVHNGANNGFQMLLDAESYDYAASPAGTEGFVIAILHQLDIPIMKHTGIQVETGQSVQIAVTPTLINTTMPCKRRFSPEKRQCYFKDEIELTHFPHTLGYRYEMSNCLYEATLQNIESQCGCTSVKFVNIVEGYQACEGAKLTCMNEFINYMGSKRVIKDRGAMKPCLAACEDQKHSFLITSAVYPNLESFHHQRDYCLVLNKLRKSCAGDRIESLNEWDETLCENVALAESIPCKDIQANKSNLSKNVLKKLHSSIAHYTKRNMVRVNVYIRDSYVQRYLTEEKITEISFVGTIGGLLGLFVGFSFISAVEFLYYLLIVGNIGEVNHKLSHDLAGKRKQEPVWQLDSGFKKTPLSRSAAHSVRSVNVMFNHQPKLVQIRD